MHLILDIDHFIWREALARIHACHPLHKSLPLRLAATDMLHADYDTGPAGLGVSVAAPAKIGREGAAWLPPSESTRYVNSAFPNLSFAGTELSTGTSTAARVLRLRALPGDARRSPPGYAPDTVVVPARLLAKALARVAHAVSDDPERDGLRRVWFEYGEGAVRVTATNGFNLARVTLGAGARPLRLALRPDHATALARVFDKTSGYAQIAVVDGVASCVLHDPQTKLLWTVRAPTWDDACPVPDDLAHLSSEPPEACATLPGPKQRLVALAKAAGTVLVDVREGGVVFGFPGAPSDEFTVAAASPTRAQRAPKLGARHLEEALRVVAKRTLELTTRGATGPLGVRCELGPHVVYEAMVMPLRS